MVDPRYGTIMPELLAYELHIPFDCCLDDHMSLQPRELFVAYIDMPSDAAFIDMCRALADGLMLDSMAGEMLLASPKLLHRRRANIVARVHGE